MDASWNQSSSPPFFYLGRFPIRVTGLIVLAHVVALLVHVLTKYDLLAELVYKPELVFEEGKIWLFVTHIFWEMPSLGWALGLWVFYHYGKGVEESLGSRDFGLLFLGWIVGPPLLLGILYWVSRLGGFEVGILSWSNFQPGWQFSFTSILTFLSFARMFPNASFIFFGFPVKWLALIGGALQILAFVSTRSWINLAIFLIVLGLTRAVLARLVWLPEVNLWDELKGGGKVLEFPAQPKQQPSKERARSTAKDTGKGPYVKAKNSSSPLPYQAKLKYESPAVATTTEMATVDEILEKISKEGVSSLTDGERAVLESASKKLAQRDRKEKKG